MNNPFHPITESPNGVAAIPGHPSMSLVQESPVQPVPHQMSPEVSIPEAKSARPEVEKKKGFFGKLFGGAKSPAKEEEAILSQPVVETPFTLLDRSMEGEAQLQGTEVNALDVLSPMPVENIDALTRTQVQVTGVLEKVAGKLDESGLRDGLVIDSLSRVDAALLELSRTSEQSVMTMGGMKGVFAEVSESMEAMQGELKDSGIRYEELCEKLQKTEHQNTEVMAKLQKRTLMVMGFLGIAVVVCLVLAIAS